MKKPITVFFAIFSIIIFLNASSAAAQDEKVGFVKRAWRKIINRGNTLAEKAAEAKPPESKQAPQRSPLEELSEEELRVRINDMLEAYPEAAEYIPGLKITYSEEGTVENIEFEINGALQALSDMDKEALVQLHHRVARERTRMQTERIQRQLEMIRAAQNISKIQQIQQQPPKPPVLPPQPPKIPTPPPRPPSLPRK